MWNHCCTLQPHLYIQYSMSVKLLHEERNIHIDNEINNGIDHNDISNKMQT